MRFRRSPTLPAAGLAALMLAAPAAAQQFGAEERGAAIVARWCSDCHSTDAAARASDVAPSFPEVAQRRSPDYLRGFLANPHLRGVMPPFELSREHVEDIVAYLESLE